MRQTDWHQRIKIDSVIHHGNPCIVGTRVPFCEIVASVANCDVWDEILSGYPQLRVTGWAMKA